jgi:hypothetical protein
VGRDAFVPGVPHDAEHRRVDLAFDRVEHGDDDLRLRELGEERGHSAGIGESPGHGALEHVSRTKPLAPGVCALVEPRVMTSR